jgi:hypothetical protein
MGCVVAPNTKNPADRKVAAAMDGNARGNQGKEQIRHAVLLSALAIFANAGVVSDLEVSAGFDRLAP